MLNVNKLTLKRGKRSLYDALSFRVPRGTALALIGANGCGKSSLLLALAGLLTPEGGTIDYRDTALADIPCRAQHIGLLPQYSAHTLTMRCDHAIANGRYPFARKDPRNTLAINAAIDAWRLRPLLSRLTSTLSGGEQQRVRLATLFAQAPSLLLLDEPTTHLDMYYQRHCLQLLQAQLNAGHSIVIATHDITFAKALASHTLLLDAATPRWGTSKHLLSEMVLTDYFQEQEHDL